MPISNYPILEVIIRQLVRVGITDLVLAVGHLSHLIQAYFQDGARFGARITYSFEDKPLGTAGPIGLVLDQLSDDFLVMNGDLLTTLNYSKMLTYHKNHGGAATIGLYHREVKIDFGVIEVSDDRELLKYIEKPTYKFTVSMGVNILQKESVRQVIEPGQPLDIPDLMLRLKAAGKRVYCYSEPCMWLDIGRVDDYQQANAVFEQSPGQFLPEKP